MKFLFIITGIGLGHSIREAAIISEIKKQDKNAEIVIAGFSTSYNYFKDKYPTAKIYGHNFPEDSFTINPLKALISNALYPIYSYLDIKKLTIIIKEYEPDRVIVDIQPVGMMAAKRCKRKTIAVYNVDPEEWLFYTKYIENSWINKLQAKIIYNFISSTYSKADTVIIPSVKRHNLKGKICFVHPIIRTSPEELPSESILMKKLGLKKPPIVVMLGGSKFGFTIARKIAKLAKTFDEDFIFFGYKEFKDNNVTSFRFKENFLEYLKVSKAAIILSGHNAPSEAMVYKKPTLIFPFKNYIEHYINVHRLEDLALIKHISNSVKEKELKEYIQELLGKLDLFENNIRKSQIQSNGTKEAVKLILR